jgi:hypothetical protein
VDEGATLGGLESEDDAEPSHGFLAVLSSLWGRGYLTHRLRIRFPEDKGAQRPRQPGQPRRLTGPAGRGSGRGLTTLGTVSAVSATLPRPRGSALRLRVGRHGTSAAARRPRAPQAYSSLGRAVHHRQDFEARNIQVGQRSRRGLQQRLEHPTSTSLLPLRCFKSFIYLVFSLHTKIKSNRQGRIGLASAKPDPPSVARRGEPPLHQNFPRKIFLPRKIFYQNDFRAFSTISITESCKTSKSARKRQGRLSRGTPTPPGYGYLTHHLPRKVTLARISDFATDEQVLILEMRGNETQLYKTTIKVFRPRRPQKTHAYCGQTVLAGSDIGRATLGVVSTFGKIWPGPRRRREREDLHLKGGRQHRAWARRGHVKPLNLG